jgi:hypothetical protein
VSKDFCGLIETVESDLAVSLKPRKPVLRSHTAEPELYNDYLEYLGEYEVRYEMALAS